MRHLNSFLVAEEGLNHTFCQPGLSQQNLTNETIGWYVQKAPIRRCYPLQPRLLLSRNVTNIRGENQLCSLLKTLEEWSIRERNLTRAKSDGRLCCCACCRLWGPRMVFHLGLPPTHELPKRGCSVVLPCLACIDLQRSSHGYQVQVSRFCRFCNYVLVQTMTPHNCGSHQWISKFRGLFGIRYCQSCLISIGVLSLNQNTCEIILVQNQRQTRYRIDHNHFVVKAR